MKRIMGMILVLAMLVSSVPVFSSEFDEAGAVPESIELLQFLEIAESDFNNINFNTEQKVTRADFAIYFEKLLNRSAAADGTLYYNDVSKNHFAFGAITDLTASGYLSGIGDKTFKPDEIMSVDHAMSAILKAMGYGVYIETSGLGAAASYSGVSKGIGTGNGELTLGTLFDLMYNALLSECFEIGSISGSEAEMNKGDTLLYKTRNMQYVKKGTLTGAYGVSINGEEIDDDEAVIDGYIYKTELTDLFEFIGYEVKYIYIEDDKEGDELVWVKERNTGSVLKISADEDCSFNKAELSFSYYDENDKQKTVKLAPNIVVIYNGAVLYDGISEAFKNDKFELTLIEDGGKYNLAVIWAYENIVVSGKDSSEKLVYDKKSGASFDFDEDNYDRFEIVSNVGDELKFSEINTDDVISIFKSKDNTAMKAVVSSRSVSGDIVSLTKERGVKVDGEWYEFYLKNDYQNLTSAKSVTLLLDFNSYVAYYKTSFLDKNSFVAYVSRAAYDEDNDCLLFKIFDENGELRTVFSENKISIDNTNYYADANTVETAFNFTSINGKRVFKPQLMLFRQDSSGVIKRVYKASDEGGTTRSLIKNQQIDDTTKYYGMATSGQDIIGTNVLFDSSTKLFIVPEDKDVSSAQKEDYSVGIPTHRGGYPGAVTYKVTTDDIFYEQYIVYKSKITTSISDIPALFTVDTLQTALDEDDEIVWEASGYLSGNQKTYRLNFDYGMKSDILSAKKGDIYVISTDEGENEIVGFTKVYKNEEGNYKLDYYGTEGEGATNNNYAQAKSRFFLARVTAKEGTALKLQRYYNGDWHYQVANLKSGAGAIVVCDKNSKYLYKGGADDVNVGSIIIVNTSYNSNLSVTVYK